jgi:hypothetical protein
LIEFVESLYLRHLMKFYPLGQGPSKIFDRESDLRRIPRFSCFHSRLSILSLGRLFWSRKNIGIIKKFTINYQLVQRQIHQIESTL